MSKRSARSQAGETIRVVSKRTGFSMEVLRAWERRFGFPKPERRPESNRRLYSGADVTRLMAIRRALDCGYRIGDVIAKSLPELEAIAGTTERDNAATTPVALADVGGGGVKVEHLIELLTRDDNRQLEGELRQAAASLGPRRFVTELVGPFAIAVGEAWAVGQISVRHEHVATECLTTRLRQMLDAYQDVESRPHVLLATLPGESHTLPLQMVALYLLTQGAKPRLLGGPTPVSEIAEATQQLDADIVGLTVTPAADRVKARRAIRSLVRTLPEDVPLWIGGGGADALDLDPETASVVTTWPAIDDALAAWRR